MKTHENIPINSIAFVNLISVRLEGLQSLIEYSKIRSNGSLLNYRAEQGWNNMPNEVFVHKDCRRKYTRRLQKNTKTRKCY